MIFVTVGHQMPFDRLVRAVDEWAGARGRRDVFAQVGDTDYRPAHLEHARSLTPEAFAKRLAEATAIVAHAGMGTILSALQAGKPILVMPRRGELRETRNDHQLATAERLSARGLVHVARDERELPGLLDQVDDLRALATIERRASPELLEAIRRFL